MLSILKRTWKETMKDEDFLEAFRIWTKLWENSIWGKAVATAWVCVAILMAVWGMYYLSQGFIAIIGKIL